MAGRDQMAHLPKFAPRRWAIFRPVFLAMFFSAFQLVSAQTPQQNPKAPPENAHAQPSSGQASASQAQNAPELSSHETPNAF